MSDSQWSGCETWELKPGWTGAKNGHLELGHLGDRVWPEADYGSAFAYLYRRFGNSPPSDTYKDLCEYRLTTPDPEVVFWINLSGLSVEVGYFITHNLARSISTDDRVFGRSSWRQTGEKAHGFDVLQAPEGTPYRRAIDAIEAGMKDLLRPVRLRDTYFNIEGPCEPTEDSVLNIWEREDQGQ